VALSLEAEDYAIGAAILPACAVGAPHDRARLWFVAHSNSQRLQERNVDEELGTPQEPLAWREFKRVHAEGSWETWQAQSSLRPFVDGVPARVAKLRAAGNAIVPQVAAEFIKASMS
jgi:DNA (cytosine-5)-methyltransferase 1